MTTPVTTKLQDRYYRLRDLHIKYGNIVAGAENWAEMGRYAAAIEWLREAENSDWIREPAKRLALKVAIAVAELGETALEVADSLRAKGIKGCPNNILACPIANLILTLPGVETAEVVEGHAIVWTADQELAIDLPAQVAGFIVEFDRGIHLDLVRVPAVA